MCHTELRVIDFLLGEGTSAERASFVVDSSVDRVLAHEVVETEQLLQRMRRLVAPERRVTLDFAGQPRSRSS